MHPYEIVSVISGDKLGWLGQYQLLQEKRDLIVLRVVPLSPPPADGLARLEARLRSLLGTKVELRILLVPEIDLESSGKFRVSRSMVRSPYDGMDWGSEGTG